MSATATATNPLHELVGELKTLRNQFDAKLKAIETQDDLKAAEDLKTKIADVQNRINVYTKRDEMLNGDLKSLDSYLNDPVRAVPFSDGGSRGTPNVLGSYDSGTSYLEAKNGQLDLMFEDGEGVFGEKAWKAIHEKEYASAFRSYLKKGPKRLTAAEVKILSDGEDPASPDCYFAPARMMRRVAMKTLETGLDDQGGYINPAEIINRLVQRKPTPTRIAGLVGSVNTTKEFVEMMKLNYASDNIYSTAFRVTKTGEQASSTTAARVTDTNLFGTIKIPVHTFMITGLVTLNMIEDASFNPLQFFTDKFNETVDILYDDKILNGTGRQEPLGMLQNVAGSASGGGTDDPQISVIYTGDANTLTADGLIALNQDVPEQYDENCRYVFNKTSTHKTIKLLKDLNDRYLFGYGTADSGLRSMGRPTDLDGYPYVWSQLMPNVAANNYPILFGDLGGYTLVRRVGFSVQVLREVYAELGQVAVVGRVRFGGQTLEPWRLRAQKVHA